ncbi:hypothetical protein BKH46_03995 [Helicobacter sp. 12S02634-8]|uniref:pertactin-like passenger domain-containing protein n=1 Tax=Helicobacter sp. 12S02634-8 TaxID=1476199 RepID=UPI000BA5CDBA|nr:pertactin-like passenger domain-containing protein [Helicobacter sp. 12S02634-8]PAF47593.1 hypothetical protein BKH46_03995 [Helicobacter sp. 12S02634-8]
MQVNKLQFILIFFITSLWGADNTSVTQLPQNFTSGTHHYVENIDFTNTPSGYLTSELTDEKYRYTGILFHGYDTMHIPHDATVVVDVSGIPGNYNDWAGMLFRGRGREKAGDSLPTYRIQGGGNIVFRLGNLAGPNKIEGMFLSRRRGTFDNSAPTFVFDVNMGVMVVGNDFYIARGLFNINDGDGGAFIFNKNVTIDASKMVPSIGWKGSGKGYRSIFSVGGGGIIRVNANADGSVLDDKNIIQLKGDISVENTTTSASRVYINLTNPDSFFQGRFSLQGSGQAQLRLSNGGKWVLAASSKVNILDINNASIEKNESELSMVDFISIKDGEVSFDAKTNRLSDPVTYSPRTLVVDELKGNNGIFKLMTNFHTNQSDHITINKDSTGKHYLQIYPDYSNIEAFTKPTPNAIEVAKILQGGVGLNFETKDVKIGLFTFKANINKLPIGRGYQWVIGDAIKSIPFKPLTPATITPPKKEDKPAPATPSPPPAPTPPPAPKPEPAPTPPKVEPTPPPEITPIKPDTTPAEKPKDPPATEVPKKEEKPEPTTPEPKKPELTPVPIAITPPAPALPTEKPKDLDPMPAPITDPPPKAPLFFVSQNDLGTQITKLLGVQYSIYRIHTDSITKHIDELFYLPQDFYQHIWADYYAGKLSDESTANAYWSFQGGYDYAWSYEGFRGFVGGLGDYTSMRLVAPFYTGKAYALGLGAYAQGSWYYQKNFGISIDAYTKYVFTNYNADGSQELDYNHFKNTYNLIFLNFRVGFKAPISADKSWFVEPGVKLGWAYINGGGYGYKTTAPFLDPKTGDMGFSDIHIAINQEAGKFFGNKLFLDVGKIFQNHFVYFDMRAGLDFAYDSSTGGDVYMIQEGYTDYPIHAKMPVDYRLGAGLASHLVLGDKVQFYFYAKRTFFSHMNTDYLVSLGFRMDLGFSKRSIQPAPSPQIQPRRRQSPIRKNVGDSPRRTQSVEVRSRQMQPKEELNPNYRPMPKRRNPTPSFSSTPTPSP